jgi:vacuolar-type H+-ATPase subunit H
MNLEELIDELDLAIDKGWNLPLSSGKCVIEGDYVKELISDIRSSIPAEIKQAKSIVNDRSEIIAVAKKEAESIIRQAEERAKQLVSQEEIVRQAQQKSSEIIAQMQQRVRDLRQNSTDYIESMFRGAEEGFTKALADLRQAKQTFKTQI